MSAEPWQLTVVRLRGLHFLRPEKSWRPIITVHVGDHQEQKTVLGCDGQNINMKEFFGFHDVDIRSRIEIHVWRKSESKRKGKKRQLTASTSLTLGELLRKQGATTQTELRLRCMNLAGKRTAKGQPQKCATITVRLRAPFSPPLASSSQGSPSTSEDERISYFVSSGRASETLVSDDCGSHNPLITISDTQANQIRRRRIRAYKIYSDDSSSDGSGEDEYPSNEYLHGTEDSGLLDDQFSDYCEDEDERNPKVVQMGTMSWIAHQLLPRFTDEVNAPSSFSSVEALVNRFSPYKEMQDATSDAEYQNILNELKAEWKWGMNILMGLCGLNATVFGFTPDVLFSVESQSKKMIAVSGVSAGLGLVVNFWYQFFYMASTGAKFKDQARDKFGTYFFFCMCCRLPTFLMLVSSCALLAFMFLVAFEVWPYAVMIVAFFAGVLVSLQYLLFGAHRLVLGIRWVFRKFGMAYARVTVISRPRPAPSSTTTKPEDADVETKKDPENGSGIVVEVRAVEEGEEC